MKTFKTTAKMIALSLTMSVAITITAFAIPEKSHNNPSSSDVEMISVLELDADFNLFESEIREEGVLECENTEIIVVLGQDDEIVYQGSQQLEDENNAFLKRLLTKADFIISSGGKSFYKVF